MADNSFAIIAGAVLISLSYCSSQESNRKADLVGACIQTSNSEMKVECGKFLEELSKKGETK